VIHQSAKLRGARADRLFRLLISTSDHVRIIFSIQKVIHLLSWPLSGSFQLNAFTLDYCDLKIKIFYSFFAKVWDHSSNEANPQI